MRRLVHLVLTLAFIASPLTVAAKSVAKPKLILVLVFDQFRSDTFERFGKRFLPAKTKDGVGGFRYLLDNGAFYPQAQHGVLHNMTCPGHAAILSGAYSYQNGIAINDWYDHESKRRLYCVEDPSVALVGAVSKKLHPGTSPKNLVGSTFGDELKNAGFKSKVFTVALKDRAAILLGGHRADLALWFDEDNFKWVSSRHYLPTGKLPLWVDKLNLKIGEDKGKKLTWMVSAQGTGRSTLLTPLLPKKHAGLKAEFPHEAVIGTEDALFLPYGVEQTVEAAEVMLSANKLGRNGDPDVLAVSFSTHDFVGHVFGPNSRETEEITIVEDRQVSRLLNYINKTVPGGLKNTLVVLSGDHGVGPNPEWLKGNGIDAGRIPEHKIEKAINAHLDAVYKKPKNGEWIAYSSDVALYLNRDAIKAAKLNQSDVEKKVVSFLEASEWRNLFAHLVTATDVKERKLPGGLHETQILRTFFPGRSGDVMIIPKPFHVTGLAAATHESGYAYDRIVPIVMAGESIKPGKYAKPAQVIDIAPTLAFLTGVMPPSGSEGRVLDEALK